MKFLLRFTIALLVALSLGLIFRPISGFSQEHPGCFMINQSGRYTDLKDICPAAPASAGEPELGTGDVQLTLRWTTGDDLDLSVKDPSGDTASFRQKKIASGAELDVDSNAGCTNRRNNPVENIFWPPDGAPGGNYEVEVNLFQRCGTGTQPIDFRLIVLVKGTRKEYAGQVENNHKTAALKFSVSGGSQPSNRPATQPSNRPGTQPTQPGISPANPPTNPPTNTPANTPANPSGTPR